MYDSCGSKYLDWDNLIAKLALALGTDVDKLKQALKNLAERGTK